MTNRKLLILDLDETLVFASDSSLDHKHDFSASYYFVYKRPYLDEFIEYCFEKFRVAVWTSSNELYANFVTKEIFGDYFQDLQFVWSRDRCVRRFDSLMYDYYFIKDLKKVKRQGYNLEEIIMIDNTPRKLSRNYGNLVKVSNFDGDRRDEELLDLMTYLDILNSNECIRSVDKRSWRRKLY